MLGHLLIRADGGGLVGALGAGGGVVELVVVAVGERVVGGQRTTDGWEARQSLRENEKGNMCTMNVFILFWLFLYFLKTRETTLGQCIIVQCFLRIFSYYSYLSSSSKSVSFLNIPFLNIDGPGHIPCRTGLGRTPSWPGSRRCWWRASWSGASLPRRRCQGCWRRSRSTFRSARSAGSAATGRTWQLKKRENKC